jgi:hypothetical protein
MLFQITIAKRGIDRQNLSITHMTNGASLRDLMTMHRQRDVNVHHLTRLGIRQVLSCGPYGFATRSAFHRGNCRSEATAAKKEAATSTNALHDRQDPTMRVVSGLQSQELSAIHRCKL